MDCEQKGIQREILDAGIYTFWDRLLRYSRGTPGLLLYLYGEDNPVTVGSLAERLGVSLPRVSSILRCLEFSRLIRRVKRKEDHRSTYVELSDKGRARAEELAKKQDDVVTKLKEKVGEETLRRFLDDAKTIQTAFDGLLKEDPTCFD